MPKTYLLVFTCVIIGLSACSCPVVSFTKSAAAEIQFTSLPSNTILVTQIPPTEKLAITPLPSTNTPRASIKDTVDLGDYNGSVLFIFGSGFDYRHHEGTRKSLERSGYQVHIASNTLDPIEGNITVHGFEIISRPWQTAPLVNADLLLKDIKVSDFKGIVFISDSGILSDPSPEIDRILLQAAEQGVVLAAQEFGVYLLAEADLLEDKKVTANPLICREMEVNYNAICTLMPVQRDAGIVTADPTMSTVSFARAIMAEIDNAY